MLYLSQISNINHVSNTLISLVFWWRRKPLENTITRKWWGAKPWELKVGGVGWGVKSQAMDPRRLSMKRNLSRNKEHPLDRTPRGPRSHVWQAPQPVGCFGGSAYPWISLDNTNGCRLEYPRWQTRWCPWRPSWLSLCHNHDDHDDNYDCHKVIIMMISMMIMRIIISIVINQLDFYYISGLRISGIKSVDSNVEARRSKLEVLRSKF